MNVDGASNVNGAGASVVLVSPSGTVHESAISIGFPATNNEAEYEALIAGLTLSIRLGADSVHVLCDSQLVVGHLNDDYQAKDSRMNAYISYVLALFKRFGRIEVEWIPRENNAHANALAGLASVFQSSGSRTIVFDAVEVLSVEPADQWALSISLGPCRMDPIFAYLKHQVVPPNRKAAHKVRCQAANYYLCAHDVLYQ